MPLRLLLSSKSEASCESAKQVMSHSSPQKLYQSLNVAVLPAYQRAQLNSFQYISGISFASPFPVPCPNLLYANAMLGRVHPTT